MLMQIEDKDVPILSHLVDIRVVNLRDEEVGPSDKHDKDDEDEDEDEDGPKVRYLLLSVFDVACCCYSLQAAESLTTCNVTSLAQVDS